MAVVLIVEDEEPLRVLAESIIQYRGHTTLVGQHPRTVYLFVQAANCAFRFLRKPNKPITPRPVAITVTRLRAE
jgi:hypothetical protein